MYTHMEQLKPLQRMKIFLTGMKISITYITNMILLAHMETLVLYA